MEKVELKDLKLYDFGNTIQIGGVVYSGNGKNLICLLPNDADINDEFGILDLGSEEWKTVLRQTDLMETELFEMAGDRKIVKALVRKTTRVIEQGLSWRVFKRDGYMCRYCAIEGIPMTVDHLVLWEMGGPTIEENLVTACRKCNKRRGNTLYEDWLESSYYKQVSQNLTEEVRDLNEGLLMTLGDIPLRKHTRSR